jgi:hypothetical protein
MNNKVFNMKKIKVFLIGLIFCTSFVSGQDLKPEYQKFIKIFISNVKSGKKEAVADMVRYPLKREIPIPTIKNKAEFVKRYDQIFDTKLRNEIIKSNVLNDWSEMGWRGIMLNQGNLWIDTDGKIIAINYQSEFEKDLKNKLIFNDKKKLHPSIAKFKKPEYVLETLKFKIRIDDLGNDNYRYASWSIKQPMSEKPDLVITKGKWFQDGTGGNQHFEFKKGNYVYECHIIVLGEKNAPPAKLIITQSGKEILSQNAKFVSR